MPKSAPLQVLVVKHPQDTDAAPFEDAIVRALQGGKELGGYLASGEDLGIQLSSFTAAPLKPAPELLDRFLHTLVVVLIDRALITSAEPALADWLAACWAHVGASAGRHAVLPIPMDERVGAQFAAMRPAFSALQMQPVEALGERAVRPAMLALLALHRCRELLAKGLPQLPGAPAGSAPGYLRLFISHAKMDSLPLAQALAYQIASVPWLASFYDARDLPAGCDWQRELEMGVGSSLIIMLRTEAYDSRHWCQQEVLWADEYATPAVLVDARTNLNHPGSALPLDRVPVVRIPDGNLLRVLFTALREGVRFLHFARLVEEMKQSGELPSPVELRVFSFAPSMRALLRACGSLSASGAAPDVPRYILYPDPVLGSGTLEAAQALVAAHAPGTHLATPNSLAATAAVA